MIDNTAQAERETIIVRVDGVVAIENESKVTGTLEERLAPATARIGGRGKT